VIQGNFFYATLAFKLQKKVTTLRITLHL